MKKLFLKLIAFFKKENITKYVVQIGLFFVAFLIFFFLAAEDVISSVIGAVIGFLFSTMLLYVFKVFVSYFEDMLKVNSDTEAVLQIYRGAPDYRKKITLNGTSMEFAYADSLIDQHYNYHVVDDKEKMFELDEFIQNNFITIFGAHSNSTKINSKTIRLDRFTQEGNDVTFYLSRSTVFNHLATNRAMDFILFDDVTLRSIYEYGPRLNPYEKSKMSNHIGINGLVFLNDGRLLVPQRNGASTISKNQITSSIAIKLEFPTDGSQDITADYLLRQNIIDNLTARIKLDPRDIDPERVQIQFLGFGQHVYEGGKPQFYYAVTLLDIDTDRYFHLGRKNDNMRHIDVDKCIYVADYDTYHFGKKDIRFDVIDEHGKRKQKKVQYELSYLCNLWHYEKWKNANQ